MPSTQENYTTDIDAALRHIFLCSLREKAGDESAVVDAFSSAIRVILSAKFLFQPVPIRLYTSGDCRPNLDYPGHDKVDADFRLGNMFFPEKGVLLIDKLNAKAGGAHRYIYRARGQRLYLFQDGTLAPVYPYGEFADDKLALRTESLAGLFNAFEIDSEELRLYIFSMLEDPNSKTHRFICRDILAMLGSIKEPFRPIYPLEYLILPPDVDLLSNFSIDIRRRLWNICLSGEFASEVGVEQQEQCMSMLLDLGNAPTPGQLIAYLANPRGGEGLPEVLRRIERLANVIEGYHHDVSGVVENYVRQTKNLQLQRPHDANSLFRTVQVVVTKFQELIEKKGLWKELWHGADVRGEKSLQRLFYAFGHSFCEVHNLDLTPEADAGNGPVDFKLSAGAQAKVLVELKLSTNPQVVHGYRTQLEIYKIADATQYAIYILVDVGGLGEKLQKLNDLRNEIIQRGDMASEIVYIDGRKKLSASRREDS
ncbi:hypothetical protein KPB05_38200 [Burkholderia gladioli]|uniref:hypothetical protein n=1 Tax=Burkholderia gladioli TaxID=28095 RepID=UPI0028666AED|nr:hypothetical protein [Burkholderia gladioli]MDR8093293.1 hypothetical protein [Burkholderia gladioli]